MYLGPNSHQEHGNRMLLIWLHGLLVAQRCPAKEIYQGLIAIGNVKMAGEIKFFIQYTLFFWKLNHLIHLIQISSYFKYNKFVY